MDNNFYKAFGAWPETHLVIDKNGKLAWRSENESGDGTIIGLHWDKLVDELIGLPGSVLV